MLQPSCHPNSAFFMCRLLGTVTVQCAQWLCIKAWLTKSWRKVGVTPQASLDFLHVNCRKLSKFFSAVGAINCSSKFFSIHFQFPWSQKHWEAQQNQEWTHQASVGSERSIKQWMNFFVCICANHFRIKRKKKKIMVVLVRCWDQLGVRDLGLRSWGEVGSPAVELVLALPSDRPWFLHVVIGSIHGLYHRGR